MAAEGEGVPGWAQAAQPEPPLDVTLRGDRGVLHHVRNTNVGLCNPRIEKGRSGNNPDKCQACWWQGQIDSSPVQIACLSPTIYNNTDPLLPPYYLL